MTGITYQNRQCLITLQEILKIEEKIKLTQKIKNQIPSFLRDTIPEDMAEHLGHQISIPTTPEEYESTKIRVGQVVKINMPTQIADIILIKKNLEKSEIKLE